MNKVKEFFADARSAGWATELTRRDLATTVTATKDGVTIVVTWLGGACQGGSRTANGKTLKLRNASAARSALRDAGPAPKRAPRKAAKPPEPVKEQEPRTPASARAVMPKGDLSDEAKGYLRFLNGTRNGQLEIWPEQPVPKRVYQRRAAK